MLSRHKYDRKMEERIDISKIGKGGFELADCVNVDEQHSASDLDTEKPGSSAPGNVRSWSRHVLRGNLIYSLGASARG